MNETANQIFGFEPMKAEGKPLSMLMPDRYRELHRIGMERIRLGMKSRVVGKTLQLHGLHTSGTEFPMELTITPFESKGRNYYAGVVRKGHTPLPALTDAPTE